MVVELLFNARLIHVMRAANTPALTAKVIVTVKNVMATAAVRQRNSASVTSAQAAAPNAYISISLDIKLLKIV